MRLHIGNHTFRICAIEFPNSSLCIMSRFVSNIGDSLGAASSIVRETKLQDRSNSIEKILYSISACAASSRGVLGHTSKSSSVKS